MKDPIVDEVTQQDLKEVLLEFWLTMMQSTDAEFPERMKASELLANYILHEGRVSINKRKQNLRPPTTEIMRLAAQLEKGFRKSD